MPASELEFWWQVYLREFLGSDRDYFAAAKIEAAVQNFAGKQLKDDVHVVATDLMPFIDRGDDEPEPAEAADQIRHSLDAFMGLQQADAAERDRMTELRREAEQRMADALAAHAAEK